MNFQPAIKWSGSKRSQCDEIISYFPRKIETYYESFLGGGSVAYRLMNSDIKVNKFILSDLNSDLINLYKLILNDYKSVVSHYEFLWNELNKDSDFERKKLYFAEIRKRLNEKHDPKDFMFIMRTTTNGMPRYNSDGEFNNSFHVTRNGIEPFRLEKILKEWNKTLNNHNVEFINASYDTFSPNENDFCYYDPPYANTKGMYFGAIDNDKFFNFLQNLKCPYCFSFDGYCEEEDSTYDVPKSVYDEHIYLKSGNSSFVLSFIKDADGENGYDYEVDCSYVDVGKIYIMCRERYYDDKGKLVGFGDWASAEMQLLLNPHEFIVAVESEFNVDCV